MIMTMVLGEITTTRSTMTPKNEDLSFSLGHRYLITNVIPLIE